MKKVLMTIMLFIGCIFANAQSYSIQSEGVDNSGNYVVRIVVSTKKKPSKTAEDLVRQYAVHGVMFRGITAAKGYSAQPPLIKDPNIEQTKKEFFEAFWRENGYSRYTSIVPSSMTVMKNKQSKMTETSALVTVSKELLQKYLEENGIIQGFSNLW
ncbi:MAG: hypothetical protein IJK42_00625 [Prevotella sp.]|nr:hypothetical protein [Prevotella sp.]